MLAELLPERRIRGSSRQCIIDHQVCGSSGGQKIIKYTDPELRISLFQFCQIGVIHMIVIDQDRVSVLLSQILNKCRQLTARIAKITSEDRSRELLPPEPPLALLVREAEKNLRLPLRELSCDRKAPHQMTGRQLCVAVTPDSDHRCIPVH